MEQRNAPFRGASSARRNLNTFRRVLRNPLTASGLAILLVLAVAAVFQGSLAPYDPLVLDLPNRLSPPSAAHLMGTDNFGRDILSRIIYGARITLVMTVTVVLTGSFIGSLVGVAAGYVGGWFQEVVMRITDIFMAFPAVLLAMVIVTALNPGLFNAGLTLVIVNWPEYARVMRGQTLSLVQNEYVTAARAAGAGRWRIMLRHIFPNCVGPLIVQATINLGVTALSFAALGFLGLGAQAPSPEWGLMISNGRKYFLDAPWFPVFPGLAIALTVLAFNFLGDGLRDILDPRARR
jgi:peptide/nickel transport system permease protein